MSTTTCDAQGTVNAMTVVQGTPDVDVVVTDAVVAESEAPPTDDSEFTLVPNHVFRWSPATERWEAGQATPDAATPPPGSMRLATLNVLHDHRPWHERQMLVSEKRYAFLPAHIEAIDADVVALHDVTKHALAVLQGSDVVRTGYSMTAIGDSMGERPKSVLLSRLPVAACFGIHLSRHREDSDLIPCIVVIARPSHPGGAARPTAIAGLRSVNDDITHTGVADRAHQLVCCTKAARAAAGSAEAVLLCDTNVQQQCEDGALVHAGVLDCWAETHFADGDDGQPGNTHDPGRNALLLNLNPAERRQLRPDRVLVAEGAHVSPCGPANLWATEPLPSMDPAAANSRWAKFGLVPKTVGLFLSHRFGVLVDVKSSDVPFAPNALVRERLDTNARKPMYEPKPADMVDAAFALAGQAAVFAGRLVRQR